MLRNCNNLNQKNCICKTPKDENFRETIIAISGPTGPTGATGIAGEKGISEKISVDHIYTLSPSEQARVEDNFTENTHHLSFYIPGVPYKNDKSVAQLIKNSDQKIEKVDTQIEFDNVTNFANSTVSNLNVEVLVEGLYKVDFGTYIEVNDNATLTLYVDDNPVVGGVLLLSSKSAFVSKTILLNLKSNNKISLRVTALTSSFDYKINQSNAYIVLTPMPM